MLLKTIQIFKKEMFPANNLLSLKATSKNNEIKRQMLQTHLHLWRLLCSLSFDTITSMNAGYCVPRAFTACADVMERLVCLKLFFKEITVVVLSAGSFWLNHKREDQADASKVSLRARFHGLTSTQVRSGRVGTAWYGCVAIPSQWDRYFRRSNY